MIPNNEVGAFLLSEQFICRVGGQPTEMLDAHRSSEIDDMLETLVHLHETIDEQRSMLAEQLHTLVATADRGRRSSLISMKRDVHNRRVARLISRQDSTELPAEIVKGVQQFVHAIEAAQAIEDDVSRRFADQLAHSQRLLLEVLNNEDFRRGLLLSSRVLHDFASRNTDHLHGAKREQVTRGLLRYLTRTVMKPTPFGAFCTVIAGKLASTNTLNAQLFKINGSLRKHSFIRINRSLLPAIWDLVTSHSQLRGKLPLALNPSISMTETCVEWMVEHDGKESCRKTKRTVGLSRVLDIVSAQANATLDSVASALSRDLAGNQSSTSDDKRKSWLEALLSGGILVLDHGISVSDPAWDRHMASVLRATETAEGVQIAEALGRVREAVDEFQMAVSSRRAALLDFMNDEIAIMADCLGGRIRATNGLVVYEDCGAVATAVLDRHFADGDTTKTVGRTLEVLVGLSTQRDQLETLRAFFDHFYGADASAVPLMQFYEDSFREHLKEHFHYEKRLDLARKNSYDFGNPFRLESIAKRTAVRQQIHAALLERLKESCGEREVHLSLGDLTSTESSTYPEGAQVSLAMFCQLLSENDSDHTGMMVWPEGRTYVGFGKYFSRFLHLLSPAFLAQLRQDNPSSPELQFAEVTDDAHFNPNIHPPILRSAITYPTRPIVSEAEELVACSEVVVDCWGATGLRLVSKRSGKTVVPVDLGFLNPQMRPALFRLLACFQPFGFAMLPVDGALHELWQHLRSSRPSTSSSQDENGTVASRVIRTPRIILERKIVLARERWWMGTGDIPKFVAGESSGSYLLRLRQWRKRHGIPARVFVKLRATGAAEGRKDSEQTVAFARRRRTSRKDLYKPQFVDFEAPVMVEFFERVYSRLPSGLVLIEEALPDKRHGSEGSDGTHITELVLQFSRVGVPST